MSPYLIIGFLIALAVAGAGGYVEGHKFGVDQQSVADQAQFDKVNADIAKQKADANATYKAKADEALALTAQRDQLKNQMEVQHAKDSKATDDARTQLAGERLRFAQDSGSGGGGSSTSSANANPASNNGPATCELSEQTSEPLKQIVYDADKLRDDYALLYNWSHSLGATNGNP